MFMSEIKVDGFYNRSGDDSQPFGYIDFTDEMRIAYAPGADGTDWWGLAEDTAQAFLARTRELTSEHVNVARVWITDNRMPTTADFDHANATI